MASIEYKIKEQVDGKITRKTTTGEPVGDGGFFAISAEYGAYRVDVIKTGLLLKKFDYYHNAIECAAKAAALMTESGKTGLDEHDYLVMGEDPAFINLLRYEDKNETPSEHKTDKERIRDLEKKLADALTRLEELEDAYKQDEMVRIVNES